MSKKPTSTADSTLIKRHNLPNLSDGESSDSVGDESDQEPDENQALLSKIRDRLSLTQQRLPPRTVFEANRAATNLPPTISHHDREMIDKHLGNAATLAQEDSQRQRYRVFERNRGELPLKETILIIFLVLTGLLFLWFGLKRWGQGHYEQFLGIAFLTLCPGLYQLFILVCAIFDLNDFTYHDIPRAPMWV